MDGNALVSVLESLSCYNSWFGNLSDITIWQFEDDSIEVAMCWELVLKIVVFFCSLAMPEGTFTSSGNSYLE